MTIDFLACVNRVLRLNAVIRGDTDLVLTFNDTAHNATLNLAIVAIQDELGNLTSEKLIPYEFGAATITTAPGTRVYPLAADFTRFYGEAFFYDPTGNWQIFECDRMGLQVSVPNYKTVSGSPEFWYWEPGIVKQVGFYQVPNGAQVLDYDYEKSVMVENTSDPIPLHTEEEANQFTLMCAKRFKVLYEDVERQSDIAQVLDLDMTYKSAKAALLRFIRGTNPPAKYSQTYR